MPTMLQGKKKKIKLNLGDKTPVFAKAIKISPYFGFHKSHKSLNYEFTITHIPTGLRVWGIDKGKKFKREELFELVRKYFPNKIGREIAVLTRAQKSLPEYMHTAYSNFKKQVNNIFYDWEV